METPTRSLYSLSLIKVLSIQLELTLLERKLLTIFEENNINTDAKIVELETLLYETHELEEKIAAVLEITQENSVSQITQKTRQLKLILKDFYLVGGTCCYKF